MQKHLSGAAERRYADLDLVEYTVEKPASAGFLCAPSMGALLWVQVPPQADHSERSEAQLHEGNRVWEGSVDHKS